MIAAPTLELATVDTIGCRKGDRLTELAAALTYEARVIDELRQALLRQRAGVAADDAQAIESSVHAMGRTLLTLDEARRRRAALTSLITGGDAAPLDSLEVCLGIPLPASLIAARADLRHSAVLAGQDVAINQHVLRRALDAGDAFLQQLFSAASDPSPGYHASERPDAAPSGLLLNRMA
ncbi:MAG: hypothetical protein ABJD11_02445 [Gemmatimonadota bacterium]